MKVLSIDCNLEAAESHQVLGSWTESLKFSEECEDMSLAIETEDLFNRYK